MNFFVIFWFIGVSLRKKMKIRVWGYLGCQIWHVSYMIPYDSTGRKRNQILVSYMIPYDSTGRKGNQLKYISKGNGKLIDTV